MFWIYCILYSTIYIYKLVYGVIYIYIKWCTIINVIWIKLNSEYGVIFMLSNDIKDNVINKQRY